MGVLKTGRPPRPAIPLHGDYPAMFRKLLGEAAYDWRTYAVDEGELPADPAECDAYLITGSACGVYDPDPWIAEAKAFLQRARGRAKLVGVCFGHQLMAEAFGGRVEKSSKGWGIGEHDYRVVTLEPWMDGAAAIRLPASHQDQVVEAPPEAEVILACDFTPFAGLAWRDQPAISMQPHPEFTQAYARDLIEARRGKTYAKEEADHALATLNGPDDAARVGAWIRAFLAGET